MSRAASPFTERLYGVVRVTRAWELARSSFYFQRAIAARPDHVLQRRGPKTAWSDAVLLEKIREVIAVSPFHGEDHRKVWARLRFKEVRTSKARVLRLMREAQLLAPSRTLPKPANPHPGTIITERPNEIWASDHTMTATVEEGAVTVFVAVDHCTTECVGLHARPRKPRGSRRWNRCGRECANSAAASGPARRRASVTGTITAANTGATTIRPKSPSWAWRLHHRSCASRNATAASSGSFAR